MTPSVYRNNTSFPYIYSAWFVYGLLGTVAPEGLIFRTFPPLPLQLDKPLTSIEALFIVPFFLLMDYVFLVEPSPLTVFAPSTPQPTHSKYTRITGPPNEEQTTLLGNIPPEQKLDALASGA